MSERLFDDQEFDAEVGRRIRAARRRIGISQERLARQTGLHRTTIGLIENGERNMRTVTLMLIVRSLEVDIEEILGGIEFIAPPEPARPKGTWRIARPIALRSLRRPS